MFKKWRKKRFEKGLKNIGFGEIDVDTMICEKCKKPVGDKSWSPIGNGQVRCSDCWDWL